MKKMLLVVLAAILMMASVGYAQENTSDMPKCWVFYHGDPAENDWDFYCLPTYKTYVFYHGDSSENDWDFRYDPPKSCYTFYHSEENNDWDFYCL